MKVGMGIAWPLYAVMLKLIENRQKASLATAVVALTLLTADK